MANHTEFVELAIELINEEGRAIVLQKLVGSTDPTKPWNGSGTPTVAQSANSKAVFLPASGSDLGSVVTSPELLAQVTQVALVPPQTMDLQTMNTVVDGGVVWKINWVQVLKPADQICLYVFGLKR